MLCGWAGLGLFGLVNGARPSTAAVMGLALVCSLLRGKWQISLRHLTAVWAGCLIAGALLGQGLYQGSQFANPYASQAALGLAAVQCLALTRRYKRSEEMAACFVSMTLAIACTFADVGNPLPLVALLAVQLTALGCTLRLTISGATVSRGAVLALLLSLPLGAAVAAAARAADARLGNWMGSLMISSGSTFSFPGVSQLDSMQRSQNSPSVVLRYYSTRPPRYLVGTAYVTYADRSWKTKGGTENLMYEAGSHGESVYSIHLGPPPPADFTDLVELAGHSQAIFLPRDCFQFSLLPAPALVRAQIHIQGTGRRFGNTFIASNDGDFNWRYLLLRSSQAFAPRFDNLDDDREVYLQLPPRLSPAVERLAVEQSRAGSSEGQKARLLESFLQDNFSYGFGYPFSQSLDPVEDFLTKRAAAHCELFATSLTLMLRSLRIPARYINGLVVRERSGDNDYWVVRERDAHAWVEAYLDGAWVTLDPTPPAAVEASGPDRMERILEWLAYRWHHLFDVSWLLATLRENLKNLVVYGLALGLGFFAWRRRPRWGWHWSWSRRACNPQADRATEELPLLLESFQKTLAALSWLRPPHLTLAAWSAQLPEHRLTSSCRRFLDTYACLRYGRPSVNPEEMALLKELLREVREEAVLDHSLDLPSQKS